MDRSKHRRAEAVDAFDAVQANTSAASLTTRRTVKRECQAAWLEAEGQGSDFLRRATQVKNIWIPYGE